MGTAMRRSGKKLSTGQKGDFLPFVYGLDIALDGLANVCYITVMR